MKLELTNKDVRILKLMISLLVISLVGNFLILPQMNEYSNLKMELEDVTMTADDMQTQIDLIPHLQVILNKTQESLNDLSAPYYASLENREVDQIITGLVLKHGLFPSELRISTHTPSLPGPYLYCNIGDMKASGFDSAVLGNGAGYMNTTIVNVKISGKEDAILAFVDDIDQNETSIQLRAFAISRNSYLNKDLEMSNNISASCILAVYTCSELQN